MRVVCIVFLLLAIGCAHEQTPVSSGPHAQPSNTQQRGVDRQMPRPTPRAADGYVSEGEEFRCVSEYAMSYAEFERDQLKLRNGWITEMSELLKQFGQTRWAEIPLEAQLRISEQLRHDIDRARVESSAKLGVPVDEVQYTCRPEHPNCSDLADPANQDVVGAAYVALVTRELVAVLDQSSKADGLFDSLRSLMLAASEHPTGSYPTAEIMLLVSDSAKRMSRADSAVSQFISYLPKRAILPPMQSAAEMSRSLPALSCSRSSSAHN